MSFPCAQCGGEGQLVCRPAVLPATGDRYTVDCEDCSNTTKAEHEDSPDAYAAWDREQEEVFAIRRKSS